MASLSPFDRAGKPGASESVRLPLDPRDAAFRQLLDAVDRGRPREGVLAIRELRRLGLSIVLVKPAGPDRRGA